VKNTIRVMVLLNFKLFSLKKNQPFSKKILKMADFYLLVQYNFVLLYYQIRW